MPESSGEAGDVGCRAVGQPLLPPLDDAGGEVSSVEVSGCRWYCTPRGCGGDGTVSGSNGADVEGRIAGCCGKRTEEQTGVEADSGPCSWRKPLIRVVVWAAARGSGLTF